MYLQFEDQCIYVPPSIGRLVFFAAISYVQLPIRPSLFPSYYARFILLHVFLICKLKKRFLGKKREVPTYTPFIRETIKLYARAIWQSSQD